MDLLQKTAGSSMKSQVLVFISLFCFWTTISEGRDSSSISVTSSQTTTAISTTPSHNLLPDIPKDVDKEEGLPEDVLKMIAQADIQSISDLENLLGVKAKGSDTAEMRPRSRPVHFMTRAAGCKTRAVTVDVPRYKVDPTSVGFFLWPSCVEIQRCSGCCNTKAYRCIPSHATYRPFQIAKITYRYGQKELTIHTVSIREHLSCNCTDLAKLNHSRFPSRYYKQSTDN
ncbi:platelet-derived growth factor subunit A-like isoform X4 [Mobula hypostoma]|uniref:platelet-derived growth factor subunit A-like isoform X4 n=1 Tax=Mobula hypostoma TaxID=723540 RepID=UPI002FC2E1C6